jgi:hypothetical protein
MVQALLAKIDKEAIKATLDTFSCAIPEIITDSDPHFNEFFDKPFITIVQLNYTAEGVYDLGKLYIHINPYMEIVLKEDYTFHAMNLTKDANDSSIYSYDKDGNHLSDYLINKEVLYTQQVGLCMVKSTGDVYHPSYRLSSDPIVESARKSWEREGRLLGYSLKLDGRKSLYVKLGEEIETRITSGRFHRLE